MARKSKTQNKVKRVNEKRVELRQIFSDNTEELKDTKTSSVGSLDDTLKRYMEFSKQIKKYVGSAVKSGRQLGLKMTGLHKRSFLEKIYGYIPWVGNKFADNHFQSRIKEQSLDEDLQALLDNVELYAQAVELARIDLSKGKGEIADLKEVLLGRQEKANNEIEQYAPEFKQLKELISGKEAEKAGKSKAEQLNLEQEIDQLCIQRDELDQLIGKYTFQAKCAQENYSYSKTIEVNLTEQIKIMEYQGVMLNSIAKDSAKNVQLLAKSIMAIKTGAGAINIFDTMTAVMDQGLVLASESTKALAGETSRMLTEDIYDPATLQASIQTARETANILHEAVETAYEKFQEKKGN